MVPDPHVHHRRSVRLRGHDYRLPGAYFVTLCSHGHEELFGTLLCGQLRPSPVGELVAVTWTWLGNRDSGVRLGPWVLMPNHLHGIVELAQDRSSRGEEAERPNLLHSQTLASASSPLRVRRTQPGSLPAIIQLYKAESTRRVNRLLRLEGSGNHIWQRNYYERIIRSDREYRAVVEYILSNPAQWAADHENQSRGAR